MRHLLIIVLSSLLLSVPTIVVADELTQLAQAELQALGYEVDNTDGEATTKTIVAISKFQSENGLEVTGEASPQLIGIMRATKKKAAGVTTPAKSAAPAATAATQEPQPTLEERQQACLQEKQDAAEASKKKKRGFGRLLKAVSRTSRQLGGGGVTGDIVRASSEVYNANATAEDIEAVSKDLGLTPEEVEECRNPD